MKRVHMNALTLEINLHFNFVDPAKLPIVRNFWSPSILNYYLSPAILSSCHSMSQDYKSRTFKISFNIRVRKCEPHSESHMLYPEWAVSSFSV